MTILGWLATILLFFPAESVFHLRLDTNNCIYSELTSRQRTEMAILDTGSTLTWYDFRNGKFMKGSKDYYTQSKGYNIFFANSLFDAKMYDIGNQHLGMMSINGNRVPVTAIIGLRDMRKYVSIIDFRNNIIIKKGCAIYKIINSIYEKQEAIIQFNGLLYLKLMIGNDTCALLIDTGSASTIIDKRYASYVNKIGKDVTVLMGVQSNNMITANSCIIDTMRIGSKRLQNVQVNIADLSSYEMIGAKPDGVKCIGLLGCDMLSRHKILINLETGSILTVK